MDKKLGAVIGLVVVLALFFAVNILAGAALRSARIDLTDENLYTLSDGSREIARNMDEPIRFYFYFSRTLASERPALQTYGQRVRELLEEYVRASGGKLEMEIIDPEPFSEAEDEAVQAGLVGVPVGGGDNMYFGLVATNSTDGREVIPFFDPSQEQFLEYEISRLIYTLANPTKKTVGVLSILPLEGTQANPMMQAPAMPPWQIIRELRSLFEVNVLEPTVEQIPDDVDVLLVVHPKDFSEATRYAIDQFVLGGGRAVVLVDPVCEADLPPNAQQNPMAALQHPRTSSLPDLFEAWGLTMDIGKVACDLTTAQRVMTQGAGRGEPVPYVAWLSLKEDNIDSDDAVTGMLKTVNVATAGILEPIDGATTEMIPLLWTSEESMKGETGDFMFIPEPKRLLSEFVADQSGLVIGARITGPAKSAFDGAPGSAGAGGLTGHLAESVEPINVIVIADADMLHDRFWLREETLFGQIRLGYRKLADNGDLIVNAIDNLAGSSELISIRARGEYARPFTLVERLRKEAEQQYLSEEQALQEKLQEAERKLNELQRQRPDSGELILTAEQQAEIDRFNEERVQTRKDLRAVRLDLRKDIEKLGTRLKFYNIFLVPLLVAVFAIGLGLYRGHRRRSDRRAVAQT